MPRVFIAPLGFHEDFILRSLVTLRAFRGDSLYVVTCSPVTGAVKRAFDSLIAMTTRQGLPQPNLIEVDCNNFYESMKKVKNTLKYTNTDHIFFCAGGGLRALSFIILLSLLSLKTPFTLHYEPESGVESFTIKQEFFLNLFEKPSEIELKTLNIIITRRKIDIKELAKTMKLKEKTIRNIITRLKKRGLVIKKGRKEGVEPTEIAIALFS